MRGRTTGAALLAATLLAASVAVPPLHASTPRAAPADDPPSGLTIDGVSVPRDQALFWLQYAGRNAGTGAMRAGASATQAIHAQALRYACDDRAVQREADARGIALAAPELRDMDIARQRDVTTYGGLAEYQHMVGSMYGSDAVLQHLRAIDLLGRKLFAARYGADGAGCDDRCVAAFVAREGLVATRHIRRASGDAAADRALLVRLARQLQAPGRRVGLFATLAARYSQDDDWHRAPGGSLTDPEAYGPQSATLIRRLQPGGAAVVITTADGSLLVQRVYPRPDTPADGSGHALRYWAAYEGAFRPALEARCARMTVTTTAGYWRLAIPPPPG